MIDAGTIGLRAATEGDREFCWALHRAALGAYVEAIWGWDDALQRGMFDERFEPERIRIVTLDGVDVGRMDLEVRPDLTYLALLEVDPAYQGRGIGATLLRRLLDEAARDGRPVELDVLSVNPRARALYERLGFTQAYVHGENGIKIHLRHEPATPETQG